MLERKDGRETKLNQPMNEKFENVVSLGWFCSVSMELERIGLRSFSLPFDWLLTPDLNIVLDFIKNNFDDFLNCDNLVQETDVNPQYYWDQKYNIHFYHDFQDTCSLESQIEKVKKKYNRRIERFYKTVHAPTLFVRYCYSQDELNFIGEHYDEIISLIKNFNKNNEIIFISQDGPGTLQLNKNIYCVKPDPNDHVARKFLKQCPELKKRLISAIHINRTHNLHVYRKKYIRKNFQELKNRLFKS